MFRQSKYPKEIYTDPTFKHYLVLYQGDINADFINYPMYIVSIISPVYKSAIVSIKLEYDVDLTVGDPRFPSIVYVKFREIYTLEEITPIEASGAQYLQIDTPLNLLGKGVTVGIIDTGIDYLSKEFRTISGETRINYLWDQSIPFDETTTTTTTNNNDDTINIDVLLGNSYNMAEINKAIKDSESGLDPYITVPSKDTIGHGTKMAGIIGGNGLVTGSPGVAPECSFVIVKLIEAIAFQSEFNVDTPAYNIAAIFTAFQFLYDYAIDNNIPMLIYFPLETNSGNHRGNGILEGFIDFISTSQGIVVVTGSGNEGSSGHHSSGILSYVGDTSILYLNVSPDQKFLEIEVWIEVPNILTLDIISPAGEGTGFTPVSVNSRATYNFIFEKTKIEIVYLLPEETSGDELIRVNFRDLQPGIWKLRLTARLLLSGKYNAWITYTGSIVKDTYFSPFDPFGTITNPGTSASAITVAAYNQNNNNILAYSGIDLYQASIPSIDLAAGGVNAITVAPNNIIEVANGTSVSAAVVAGACALLLEWATTTINLKYTNAEIIKFYLLIGTVRRTGDSYPNNQWGYGILNIPNIFENLS